MLENIFNSINRKSVIQSCVGSNNIEMSGNSITVNGKTIEVPVGANVKCRNGKVFIDGKEATFDKESGAGEKFKVIHLIIKGDVLNINSDCSVEVEGNVAGKINCNGSIKINGNVDGNIDCNGSVMIEGAHIGEIDAAGSVSIR